MDTTPAITPDKTEDSPHWDVPKLLAAFGTPRDVRRLLAKHGYDAPSETRVRMWRHRRSIPADELAALLWVGQREKIITDAADFIVAPVNGSPFL